MASSFCQQLNARYAAWLKVSAGATLGLAMVAIWAFAEATFWFIAPDFLIILFCAFVPAAWRRVVLAALVGSLLGGILSYVLNSLYPEQMGQILRGTPFVTSRMIAEIDELYTRHSHRAVLYQSFSFMQFKIWTHLAVRHGFDPTLYFLIVMFSRAIRFGAVAWIAQFCGRRVPGLLSRYGIALTAFYGVLFLLMLMRVEAR